jgi:hypothetical protein
MKEISNVGIRGNHPYFRDKGIRRKKERVTVLMRQMMAGGGIFDEYGL